MRNAVQDLQTECVVELGDRVWMEDRFLITEPRHLEVLAGLFPDGAVRPWATHPLDLDLFNYLSRPLGYLATWEPEGLLVFRVHC
jgi:hypothetical protein